MEKKRQRRRDVGAYSCYKLTDAITKHKKENVIVPTYRNTDKQTDTCIGREKDRERS